VTGSDQAGFAAAGSHEVTGVVARAFVGVSFLMGARGSELLAREALDAAGARLAARLETADRRVRARAVADAIVEVCRDLDGRRVE